MTGNKPFCTVRAGSISVPIYKVEIVNKKTGKTYPAWRIKYRLPGQPKPIQFTRAKLEDAKLAAKDAARKIAGGQTTQLQLANHEIESYRRAQTICENMNKTVESVCEEYHETHLLLRPGITIKDCVVAHMKKQSDVIEPKTISELQEPFIQKKRDEGLREISIGDLELRLIRASNYFKQIPIHLITADDFYNYLYSLKVGAQTRLNHRAVLQSFFNHWFVKKHLPTGWNEFENEKLARPKVKIKAPSYYLPEEMTRLLYGAAGFIELSHENGRSLTGRAKEELKSLVPYLALGAFGFMRVGTKEGEITKIDWRNVDFKNKQISIDEESGKRGARDIDMPDNLIAWLALFSKPSGSIIPPNVTYRRRLLCKLTGIKWIKNGLRKSCQSYNYALTKNAAVLTANAGNSEKVFFKFYKIKLSREAGESWSNIYPKTEPNIVQLREKTG